MHHSGKPPDHVSGRLAIRFEFLLQTKVKDNLEPASCPERMGIVNGYQCKGRHSLLAGNCYSAFYEFSRSPMASSNSQHHNVMNKHTIGERRQPPKKGVKWRNAVEAPRMREAISDNSFALA
jgi:hypothetical protein